MAEINFYLPNIKLDEIQFEKEKQEERDRWDKYVQQDRLKIFNEFKKTRPDVAKYVDPNITTTPFSKFFREAKSIFQYLTEEVVLHEGTPELERFKKQYPNMPLVPMKSFKGDKVVAYQSLRPLSGETPELFKTVGQSLFEDYYTKKQEERVKNLSEDMKTLELSIGGIYGSKGVKWLKTDAATTALTDAFTFSFLDEKVQDPIYGEAVKKRYSGYAGLGYTVGSIAQLIVLSGLSNSLGIPTKIKNATEKVAVLKKIRNVTGGLKIFVSEKMQPLTKTLKAMTAAHGLTDIGWLNRVPSTLAATVKYAGDPAMAGAIGMNQFMIGGFTEALRNTSKLYYKQDQMDWKEYIKTTPGSFLKGGVARWSIGLINDPSGWWGRFLGDSLYSGTEQGIQIFVTKKREKWDWSEFWYNFVVGHLMGEFQGLAFGGNRAKTFTEFEQKDAQRIFNIVKASADSKFVNGESSAIRDSVEKIGMAQLFELDKASRSKFGKVLSSGELKDAYLSMNAYNKHLFRIVAAAKGYDTQSVDIGSVKKANYGRTEDKEYKYTKEKYKTFTKQVPDYEKQVTKDFISPDEFYNTWFYKSLGTDKNTLDKIVYDVKDSGFKKVIVPTEELKKVPKEFTEEQSELLGKYMLSKGYKGVEKLARTDIQQDGLQEALIKNFTKDKFKIGKEPNQVIKTLSEVIESGEINAFIKRGIDDYEIDQIRKTSKESTALEATIKDIKSDKEIKFIDKVKDDHSEIVAALKERTGEVFTKIVNMVNDNPELKSKALAFYFSFVEEMTTREIAEVFNSIKLDGRTDWDKTKAGEDVKERGHIKQISNMIREFATRLDEYQIKPEYEMKTVEERVPDGVERITKKKTVTLRFKNINPVTALRAKLMPRDNIQIDKNGAIIFSLNKHYDYIKNKWGEDVAQEFLYKASKIIKNQVNKVEGGRKIKIFNPTNNNGSTFIFVSDDIKSLDTAINHIKREFMADYRDSNFAITVEADKDIQYIITQFRDSDFVKINPDHRSEDIIEDSTNIIKDFGLIKAYAQMSNHPNSRILTDFELDFKNGAELIQRIKDIYDITQLDSGEKIASFVEKQNKTKAGQKRIERINTLISELSHAGKVIDNDRGFYLVKNKKNELVLSEGNAFNVSIIEDIARNDFSDIDAKPLISGSNNKRVNELIAANKGIFSGIFGMGRNFKKWYTDMTVLLGGREETDPVARKTLQVMYEISDMLETKSDFVSGKFITAFGHEAGLNTLDPAAMTLLVKMGDKLHQNEFKYLMDRYVRNPNLLKTEKIEYKSDEMERRYNAIFGSRDADKWTQLDITELTDSCKHTDVPLAKALVQHYKCDPTILLKWSLLRETRIQPIFKNAVMSDKNYDLYKEMQIRINNKFADLVSKLGIEKIPNLFELKKDSAILKAYLEMFRGTPNERTANYIIENFYSIDPDKLTYVHHFITGKNQDRVFRGLMNAFAKGLSERGDIRASTSMREFMGRKFGTLDLATRNGYVVSDNMLENLAAELRYVYVREGMKIASEEFKINFMNELISSPDKIEFLKQSTGGYFYIPTSAEISAYKTIEKDLRAEARIRGERKPSISIGNEMKSGEYTIKYGAAEFEIKIIIDMMEQTRDILTKQNKKLGIDNRMQAAKALFGEDYSFNYVPANWKNWIAVSSGKEMKSGEYTINKGGVKDKYQELKKGIVQGFKGLGKSYRWEAGNINGWEGLYFSKDVWKAMKNLILRDDYLKYDSDYEWYNSVRRGYDKTNRLMKIIRFYKPTIIMLNDMVQMMFANPSAVKNIKWAFKETMNDIRNDERDPVFRLAQRYNVFNITAGTPSIINNAQKAIYDLMGHKSIYGRYMQKIKEQPSFLRKAVMVAKLYQSSTWVGDQILRAALFKAEFDKATLGRKMTQPELNDAAMIAAEKTNMFMVQYTRMPMSSRQYLNRLGFVMTYRIQTLRMYKEMFRMAGKGIKVLFGSEQDPDYIFNSTRATRGGQASELISPLIRKLVMTAGLKVALFSFLGFGYNSIWDAIKSYRGKRLNEDHPLGDTIEFFSMGTPLFELEKLLSRPTMLTLKYNIAAFPGLILGLMTNTNPVTGQPIWDTKGYSIKESVVKMPHRVAAGIGMTLLKTYLPIGPELVTLNQDNYSLAQKILNFTGVGYYYNYKNPKQLVEEFKAAYDVSKSQGERDRAYRQFMYALNRAHMALFNEKYKDIAEQIKEQTEKRKHYEY